VGTRWQSLTVSYLPRWPGSSTLDLAIYAGHVRAGGYLAADDVGLRLVC